MAGDSSTPRSPYSRSSSMPNRALNRPFEAVGSPRTPRGVRDSPRSGAATPRARDLPSTATVDLSEDDQDVLRTMYEDVTIASRFRTKPSAVELMAHALPGRNTYGDKIEWGKDTKLRNQVQLSTYPDSIGQNLGDLRSFTDRYLQGVVGGVHVLPFYPSSADRGFAPLTYKEVSPEFGSWEDIENIGDGLDLCMDFMVNHISAQSPQFKDFKEKGDKSEWADLFIRYNKFWGGEPTEADLGLIYTRKPRPPFLEVEHADGTKQKVWCTFDYEQVDIDAFSELGSKFIEDQLASLCEHGCGLIRLDAFGYTTKRKGTNCFFVEPEVWELLDRCNNMLKKRGTELLCEVHEHFSMQKRLADKGFWVYDFALPMLTLQALYDGDANNIKAWWLKCPRNQITTLDTHDGLGVVDVADLMSQEQIDRTKANIFDKGANANMRFNSKEYGNLDIYQINCSYYSAVGNKDEWYVLARAIQFFTPGIPLVYYVGLLAGENDIERVERTKTGRDINRHWYDLQEAIKECERPVVKVLFELCRFRNHHPAFNGEFELLDTVPDIRESTVLLPPTAYTPAPQSPVPGLTPTASMDNMTEGPPGASGSFAAQTVNLMASMDDNNQDFMADVVLERSSIDVLASVDVGDVDDATLWEVDQIVNQGHSGALEGLPATIPEEGPLPDSDTPQEPVAEGTAPSQAPEPETEDKPVETRADPKDEDDVTERLTKFAMKKKAGKIPLVDSSQHMDVSKPGSLTLTDADLPFQPFSAALSNLKDKESLLSPYALASGDPDMMTPLQQVRMVRMASRRDPEHDLPANVLCCKWTNGDNWVVMEANLDSKDLRILYVDPFDGRQKVWAVTRSLQVYKEQQAAATPTSSPPTAKGTTADAA